MGCVKLSLNCGAGYHLVVPVLLVKFTRCSVASLSRELHTGFVRPPVRDTFVLLLVIIRNLAHVDLHRKLLLATSSLMCCASCLRLLHAANTPSRRSLLALGDLILDLLALGKRLETLALDGAEVDEDVFGSILGLHGVKKDFA